ncbi:hypothetical protein IAE60_15000 [Pseudoxanthomonas mexicana]|uniref:Uncharacterized protein n=1 Tax=Pseudoxanthomonas mexicana TaxID=128785 RepID=A0A7G9TAU1_PSEMX|nr:hypothetical protein [Pseudoxanthomonas mexicana]QNN77216.1 hypothetical protein IAE60_15000 [Pseudoxanthomonas mexicana]
MAGDTKYAVEVLVDNAKQLINLASLLVGGLMATLLSNASARSHDVPALIAGLLAAFALFMSVLFQYLVAVKNLGDATEPNWNYKYLVLASWGAFLTAVGVAAYFVGCVI